MYVHPKELKRWFTFAQSSQREHCHNNVTDVALVSLANLSLFFTVFVVVGFEHALLKDEKANFFYRLINPY